MTGALSDNCDQKTGETIQTHVSTLSEKQINELYNLLYPIKNMLVDLDLTGVRALSTGKVSIPVIDCVLPLVEKAETLSTESVMNNSAVQLLLKDYPVSVLVDVLKKERSKYDSYKGLSDDDLLPY